MLLFISDHLSELEIKVKPALFYTFPVPSRHC